MVTGLRFDRRIPAGAVGFDFVPSIGMVARDIDTLGLALTKFKEPLTEAVKKVMIPSIRANFDSEGRPSWEGLADDTISHRVQYGFGEGPILSRTGQLKRRATQFSIWRVTDVSASIQSLPSDVFYGGIMQAGAEGTAGAMRAAESLSGAGRGLYSSLDAAIASVKASTVKDTANIPARPFAMFQDEDITKIEQVFDKWLDKKLAEHWGRL